MNYTLLALTILLFLFSSLGLNIYFIYKTYKKTNKSKINQDLSLLSDLTKHDRAIIEIKRIAPNHVFFRSPKDY